MKSGGEPPGLVISDYRLPGDVTGLGLIEELRAATRPDLPSILITGDTSAGRVREAEALRCHLVHKPATADVLVPLVRNLLRNPG